MKARTLTQLLMLFFILLPASAVAAGLGELRLSLIEGDVQIKNVDTGEWAPAAINLPLKDGDQLWVPEDGRAEVEARRGSIVRLDERSLLEILRVDNDALQFYLSMGLGYVNAKGGRGTTLQLETPVSSIRVYERAKFSALVVDDGHTDIAVFLGVITAENRKGLTRVEAGNMLSLGDNFADLSPLGLADAWERWNKDQDRIIEERRESVRYLPEELAGYSRDFDDNGEWVDDPDYGHIWRPTLHISIGWSPYRHGRWVWIGGDYVWVAAERWGWAPYHYGRWTHIRRHGWCWVPPARHEVYWGPGYVGWVRTSTHVSWVPLAPRETYYGHGDYGPHSVNITKVNVNKVVVKNVYKNVYVNNSVTTVHNDTFIRGKKVDVKVKENPFLKEKISVGRPEIKPERATRIAVIKEVPRSKAPPARARGIDVNKLKEGRRLVKKENQSVFLPDKAPETMPVQVRKEPKPRALRRARAAGTETEKGVAPAPEGEIKPAPPEGEGGQPAAPATLPKEGKRRAREPMAPPSTEGRPEEGGERRGGERQAVEPAPKAEAQPAPGEKVAPVEPSAPPPESKRRPRRTPPPEVGGQPIPGRGESGAGQPPVEPGAQGEFRLPPAEREVAPVEPSALPPESKKRSRRTPPPEVGGAQPTPGRGESGAGQPPVEPGAKGEFRLPPAKREVAPVEPSVPPPESKKRIRREPPPEVEGGQPPQDSGGEGRQKRERPPERQWQETPPSPPGVEAPPVTRRMVREPRPRKQPGLDEAVRERARQKATPPPEPARVEPPPVVIQGGEAPPPPAEGKKKGKKKKQAQEEQEEPETEVVQ